MARKLIDLTGATIVFDYEKMDFDKFLQFYQIFNSQGESVTLPFGGTLSNGHELSAKYNSSFLLLYNGSDTFTIQGYIAGRTGESLLTDIAHCYRTPDFIFP